jgi:hypothetical protein
LTSIVRIRIGQIHPKKQFSRRALGNAVSASPYGVQTCLRHDALKASNCKKEYRYFPQLHAPSNGKRKFQRNIHD